jgi:exportin-2 (importin alpha re-exporter)
LNFQEEPSVALDESERAVIRTHIVQQMMHTDEPGVQRQLADAISLIAAQDFPTRWPELMPQLTERCAWSICK